MSLEEKFWSKVEKGETDECWEWQAAADEHGYGRINVRGKTKLATRVSVRLDGRDPSNYYVLHKCDNPCCVNPKHLYLGNQKQNMRDSVEHGNANLGEEAPNSSLTNEEVQQINDKMHKGLSNAEIAKDYLVDEATISDIRCGNSWTHVDIDNPYHEIYEPVPNKDKLSNENVKEIKARLQAGEVQQRLAEDFNIDSSVVANIANNQRYTDIKPSKKMIRNAKIKGYKGSKLDKQKVAKIKKLLDKGDLYQKEIAKKFDVSRTLITQINNGKKWSDVNPA